MNRPYFPRAQFIPQNTAYPPPPDSFLGTHIQAFTQQHVPNRLHFQNGHVFGPQICNYNASYSGNNGFISRAPPMTIPNHPNLANNVIFSQPPSTSNNGSLLFHSVPYQANLAVAARPSALEEFQESVYPIHQSGRSLLSQQVGSPLFSMLNIREMNDGNIFPKSGTTVVLENEEDIQMVSMESPSDISDGDSPYEPGQTSLLDIDYSFTTGEDEIDKLNKISRARTIQLSKLREEEYWQKTRDCDYRLIQPQVTPKDEERIEEQLKLHRISSTSKDKQRKQNEMNANTDSINGILNKSINTEIDMEHVDDLPYEDLISVYNKLKEELTLLNCENDVPNVIVEGTAERPIELDTTFSTDNNTDDEDQLHKAKTGEVKENVELSLLEKEEANKLSLVLEKDILIEDSIIGTNSSLLPETDGNSGLQKLELNASEETTKNLEQENIFAPIVLPQTGLEGPPVDENLLREQLIRRMLETRVKDVVPPQCSTTTPPLPLSLPLPQINYPSTTQVPSSTKPLPILDIGNTNVKKIEPPKPKIDLSRYTLVFDVSGDEDSPDETVARVNPVLRNSSRLSKLKSNRLFRSNGYIHKLSTSQQEEYRKLKGEIERRELKTVSDEGLKKCEAKLKGIILSRQKRSHKVGILKRKLTNSEKQLKKAKFQVRHLQNLLSAEIKKVRGYTSQIQLDNKELSNAQTALQNDEQALKIFHKECSKMGYLLHGSQYKAPIFPEVPLQHRRKRGKSFNEVLKDTLVKSVVNKEAELSMRFLRGQIKFLLKPNFNYEAVLLFEHYVNFNFSLFQCSTFYQSSKFGISFNEFSEKRIDVLSENLNDFPTLNPDSLIVDNYRSVLQHFNSYRFASNRHDDAISSNQWSNGLNPNQLICNFELFGKCNDVNCKFQHQKDYLYGAQEKVLDVLTYVPQIDENLNLSQHRNDPKTLRNELMNFVQNKLTQVDEASVEILCKEISNEIKSQSKTSVSSFFIRSIPKELVNFNDNLPAFREQVPYNDYLFRFDLRDDYFKMKLSKICNLKAEHDPDLYLKNRFFAPEGVPISAQLEASLSTDPHNVQMWINLAYCYLKRFKDNEQDINFYIDSALHVLSRALEKNQGNAELYEQYLLFYSNKLELISATDKESTEGIVSMDEICRRVLSFCSTYRLWICYLNLGEKLSHKEDVVQRIIEQFCNGLIQFDSEEEHSKNILEVIMYRMNLYVQLNKHQEAVRFFNEIFTDNSKNLNGANSSGLNRLGCLVTKEHRAFIWLCYTHLILFRCLPYHCFQLGKRGSFLYLSNTRPFVFNWKGIKLENDLLSIENVLNRAIKNCCPTATSSDNCNEANCRNSCFALRFNMAQLSKHIQFYFQKTGNSTGKELPNSYSYLSTVYSNNFEALSHLHILQLFDIDLSKQGESIVLSLIENFYNAISQGKLSNSDEFSGELIAALKHQLQFNYWLAFYHYKCGNLDKCQQILTQNLSHFYCDSIIKCDNNTDERYVPQLYELLLFENFSFDVDVPFAIQETIRSGLKQGGNRRATSKLVYLYLSYL